MKELTHLSLFSGIGGLDLAAEWAGFESVGQCEFADYPTKVLEKHWPDVPRWRDIRTLTGESFYERTGKRTVDIISGGFPCQPFSNAGKQRGKEDDRYLWPEMVRVIKELRPTWVVGENVAGIVKLALDDVLSDLEAEGYATRTFLIPACGVGAPHQRYRTAIMAHANGSRFLHGWDAINAAEGGQPTQLESFDSGENVADSDCERIQRREKARDFSSSREKPKQFIKRCDNCGNDKVCNATGERLSNRAEKSLGGCKKEPKLKRSDWWSIEPDVGRVANGISSRVDRLKCLGNAVVPQQFYPVFKAIADVESGRWHNGIT